MGGPTTRCTGGTRMAPPTTRLDGPAVLAEGLQRRFDGTAAVERLDLCVDRGEIYGFLGPNGRRGDRRRAGRGARPRRCAAPHRGRPPGRVPRPEADRCRAAPAPGPP